MWLANYGHPINNCQMIETLNKYTELAEIHVMRGHLICNDLRALFPFIHHKWLSFAERVPHPGIYLRTALAFWQFQEKTLWIRWSSQITFQYLLNVRYHLHWETNRGTRQSLPSRNLPSILVDEHLGEELLTIWSKMCKNYINRKIITDISCKWEKKEFHKV